MMEIYLEKESVTTNDLRDGLPHWHSGIELIRVLKGSMVCRTNEEEFSLQKGDICFINQLQVHGLNRTNEKPCEHDALIISTDIFAAHPDIFKKYIAPVLQDQSFAHVRFSENNDYAKDISRLMSTLGRLRKDCPLGYELEELALSYQIFQIIYQAYRNRDGKNERPNPNVSILQTMLEYIFDSYDKKLTLTDIAEAGSISESSCNRIFKELTGMTPVSYLNQYRLGRSAKKLRNTADSIAEIAQSCGFSQQSYFSKRFQEEYGMTPLAYRKQV